MSRNLSLYDETSGCDCKLYQTTTEETYKILEGHTSEAILQNYLQCMSTWWKGQRGVKEQIKEHEVKIRKFLKGHPSAKWGAS